MLQLRNLVMDLQRQVLSVANSPDENYRKEEKLQPRSANPIQDGNAPQYRAFRRCYNCGSEDHLARNCVHRGRTFDNSRLRGSDQANWRRPVNLSEITCFNCSRKGHFARDCQEQGNFANSKASAPAKHVWNVRRM